MKTAISVLLAALLLSGCQLDRTGQPPKFTATDEWARSYPLAQGGELQIVNGSGTIDVSGGSGSTVEVHAERVGRGPTEIAARELLPRITIREDVTPGKIVLQTLGLSGLVIGVEVEVNYHVTVPSWASVHARSTNGNVTATDVSGMVSLTTTNGRITGRNLSGGVDARTINGNITMDLAAIGADAVQLRATNGSADVTLPADANANVAANFTNGKIDTGNVKLELMGEQTRRRRLGRLNAGGTPVEITTTNGNIALHTRQ